MSLGVAALVVTLSAIARLLRTLVKNQPRTFPAFLLVCAFQGRTS